MFSLLFFIRWYPRDGRIRLPVLSGPDGRHVPVKVGFFPGRKFFFGKKIFFREENFFSTRKFFLKFFLPTDNFVIFHRVFRWKGENVSSSEVESAVSQSVGLEAVVVFGVEIPGLFFLLVSLFPAWNCSVFYFLPNLVCNIGFCVYVGCEGKAGMACFTGDVARVDLRKLKDDLINTLPSYARPIFLRFLRHVDQTGAWWFLCQHVFLEINALRVYFPIFNWFLSFIHFAS